MRVDQRAFQRTEPKRSLDLVGLIAFSAAPGIALFQGVSATLGLPSRLDDTLAQVLPLAIIVVCLLARTGAVGHRLASPSIRRASLYLGGYLLVVLVSTALVYLDPIERDPDRMMQQFAGAGICMAIFFVMVASPSLSASSRSFRISLLVWAAAAILTPLSAFTPLPIGEVQGDYAGSQGLRSFGVLGDAGTFVVSFLAVAFLMSRSYVWLALALIALVVSGSRGPLVVAAAAMALSVVLAVPAGAEARPGSRAIRVVVATLVATLLLVGLQLVFAALAQRFGAINAFERLNETQFTQSDRYFSAIQGFEWFLRSPIYGNGFNAYYYFSLFSSSFGANQSNALNQLAQTLVDGGVAAVAFLSLFFFETLRPGHRSLVDRLSDPYAIRIWLITFVLLNQTAVYILPASSLTILIFGLCGIVLLRREMVRVPRARARMPRPEQRAHLPRA